MLGMRDVGHKEIPDEAQPRTAGPSLIPRPSIPSSLVLHEGAVLPRMMKLRFYRRSG
jgi:hypothetical protein